MAKQTTKTTKSSEKAGTDVARQGGEGAQAPAAYRDPFTALRTEMNRLFDDFTGIGFPSFPRFDLGVFGGHAGAVAPVVDVKEDDKKIIITAELPGLGEDDVDLSLRDGVLTLSGEKKSEKEEKGENYHVSERRYGSFQRSFRLPESVDDAKVSASFDKGVLTVELPKRKEAAKQAKKIKIAKK